MSADNKSNGIFDSNKISVIILCCDEESDLSATLKSLAGCKDKVAECIIADAAGESRYEETKKQALEIFSQKTLLAGEKLSYEEGQQISVKYCNLAANVYQNVAQLKNDAVRLASGDRALMVNAGEAVCLGEDLCEQNPIADNCRLIFKRLLLSGRGIVRHIIVNRHALDIVGGWNPNLDCGEDYELALRICDYCLDGGCANEGECDGGIVAACLRECVCGIVLSEASIDVPIFREDYYTYAYVIAKYVGRLKERGIFDEVFLNRYNEAAGYGIEDYFAKCQENFMTRGELFNKVDEATRAVLVFMEKSACNGALYHFAEAFAKALRGIGQNVYTYTLEPDEEKRNIDEIKDIAQVRMYKAAVEFQAGVFAAQLPSGELIGNILKCPKFMYEFDHPLYLAWYFMLPIKDYYVLSQDETYADFCEKNFPNLKGAWHMPLAGESVQGQIDKKYDFTFVGAYSDYRKNLAQIRKMAGKEQKIALGMLAEFKKNPDLTAEKCLEIILNNMGDGQRIGLRKEQELNKREFVTLLHKMRNCFQAVTFYYREKVVRALVEAGIELHVFSDTWKNCPFADNDKLIIHHDIPYEEGVKIIAESRVTLNVMSWHKGGMTERVANAMLNRAVCVTDKTTYIERHFSDGEDIVTFDLKDIALLPDRIKELFSDLAGGNAKIAAISKAAYKKAVEAHTWNNTAKDFMEIVSEINQN